jgi:HAD superfamily hydrolase (TIGR01509 family)
MKKRVYIFDIDDTLIIHTPDRIDYYHAENDGTLQKLIQGLDKSGVYIYTNGTYGHGLGVIKNLNLEKDVIEIFARDTIPYMKPYNESFDYVQGEIIKDMNTYDIEYLFFDDLLENLRTAKGLGWTTIWINPKSSSNEKYVDYSFSNIYQALVNFS